MLAFSQPSFAIRQAIESELSLISYLRLTSLLTLEMPNHPLAAIRAVMTGLPDVGADLFDAASYFVADHGGDLLGGAGWSVLPLCFRAQNLVGEDGGSACLALQDGSVFVRGFFLDPDLGRQGAGAGLLAHIEAEAGRAGYAAAEMVVPATSQLYYRSLGFRPVRKLGLTLGREGVLPLLQMHKGFPMNLACAA